MIIGEHIAKLDDKGRLVFPAPLKVLAESEVGGRLRFVVKKNLFRLCLEMYVDKEWKRQSEGVRARLNPFNRDHDLFWSAYMSDTAIVEPDEKMGRIQIPRSLLDLIDVRKEVVFASKDYKIEVWAKEHFPESKISGEKQVELAEKILG
ncbi:MAG: protein mraZ [Bacteroidales bacterium]|nr:protein mraZ [Bacteroidales bacterium]